MQRFFKSIDYIERNLYESISIHDVASASHYSAYHFSRMFRAITGETIKEYIRKRRLTMAAKRLLEEPIGLLDLAVACQFGSQEAFTRAFKQLFKVTPGQYRKAHDPFRLLYRDQFSPVDLEHIQDVTSLTPRIEQRSEIKVVGVAKQYTEDEPDYLKLWAVFKPLIGTIPNEIPGKEAIGIYESYEDDGENIHFTYICCVKVDSFDDVPKGMMTRTLEPQTYAVFKHRGPLSNLQRTLKYIWGSWLPKSGYEYAATPDFELYPNNYAAQEEESVLELFIPIQQ
ncbi:MAG: AraC family transcriptional regulator [Pseudomonadales bacterium]|nr:AraC family transcriptional regulator [Pseudomonadales bacterium]